MKKLLTVLSLCIALFGASISTEARTSKSKTGKSSGSATISVTKNEYGIADPTGHSYQCTVGGYTYVLTFDDPYYYTLTEKKNGKVTGQYESEWHQNEGSNYIFIRSDEGYMLMQGQISQNGNRIDMINLVTDKDQIFKIIK